MPTPIGYGFPTGQGFLTRLTTAYSTAVTSFSAIVTLPVALQVRAGDIVFANYSWSAITGASGFVDLVTIGYTGTATLEFRETAPSAVIQLPGDTTIGASIPVGGTETLMFKVKTAGTILTFGVTTLTEYGTAPTSKSSNIMIDAWGYVA